MYVSKKYGITAGIFSVSLAFTSYSFASDTDTREINTAHGIAMHGDLKYSNEFTHFEYANPNAPKGGNIRLASTGGFDSLNPFIIKGTPAAGLNRLGQGYLYDSLTTQSNDEPFSQYGSIAKTITWPEDRGWVTYEINSEARFHDGEAIRSDDVKFTFETLTQKGHPLYSSYFGDVIAVETPDDLTVTFRFKGTTNKELALIIGQLPILPKHYWEGKDFTKASLTPPVGSGPYKIKSVDPGRSIVYERVNDWWAKDNPVNKGIYNFNEVRYDYYRDDTVAIEGLKADQFDVRVELSSKQWATAYDGPQFDSGKMVKKLIEHDNPTGMQAFVYNTRRAPFNDIKVREALGYLFDFEWTNKTLFYNQYTRAKSYFNNSELGSSGLPQGEELQILNQFKDQLPEEVFTKEFKVPTTNGSGNIRGNIRKAISLLKSAGWNLKSGKMLNNQGQQMSFEIMIVSPSFERVILPFQRNLKKVGIEVDIRLVDVQQYIKRIQSFDFDVMVGTFGQSSSPGNEQRGYWHSTQADTQGSRNTIGIKNNVIDELIEQIIQAPNRESLVARTRALDRVLLWNHFVIPQWHFPAYRVIYWNKFDYLKDAKTHYFSTDTWWSKSSD
jgi:microcin C transport system substrate-binding protein